MGKSSTNSHREPPASNCSSRQTSRAANQQQPNGGARSSPSSPSRGIFQPPQSTAVASRGGALSHPRVPGWVSRSRPAAVPPSRGHLSTAPSAKGWRQAPLPSAQRHGVGSLSNALVRSRWDGDIGRAVAAGQLSLTAALRLPSYENQGVSFSTETSPKGVRVSRLL